MLGLLQLMANCMGSFVRLTADPFVRLTADPLIFRRRCMPQSQCQVRFLHCFQRSLRLFCLWSNRILAILDFAVAPLLDCQIQSDTASWQPPSRQLAFQQKAGTSVFAIRFGFLVHSSESSCSYSHYYPEDSTEGPLVL